MSMSEKIIFVFTKTFQW